MKKFFVVGFVLGCFNFCWGGKEKGDFCSWFLKQHPKEEVSEEIALNVYATIETLNEPECLYALRRLALLEIKEHLSWIDQEIDKEINKNPEEGGQDDGFLLFAWDIVYGTSCYGFHNLTPVINCPEEGKIKVHNLLCQVYYVDEFRQKLDERVAVLGVEYKTLLRQDLFVHCFLHLRASEIAHVRERLAGCSME